MTVLVTGAAGYVGSHTVKALRDLGREVVVLDNLEYGHRRALEGVEGAALVVGDIADQQLVTDVVRARDVDSVIHFAAYKAPGRSMEDPGLFFANNVAGSVGLLRALRDCGVRKIVFSSSCSVYGNPLALPVDEDHRLAPESPYGESKLQVERMLRWFDACHGMRSVSLRYFNAAGAADGGRMGEDWSMTTNLIPLAMKAALGRGTPLRVFGTDYPTPDGTAIRDYVHVLDLAEAHVRALDYLSGNGTTTTINLGTGVGSSVRQIIDMTARVGGVEVPHEVAPRRPGDPVAVYADNRKAHRVLGWRPRRRLQEIITSAWCWHSTHLDGYGRLPS